MKVKTGFLILLGVMAAGGVAASQPGDRVATSPGKPAHPISVELVASKRLEAGETGEAELVVTSRVALASMDVELRPVEGVTLTETRFSRSNGKLGTGVPVRLPLRLTASGGEAQRVRVEVRALTPDGNLITRQVELSNRVPDRVRKQEAKTPQQSVQSVESGEDVVVPAEQEVRESGRR